MFEKAKPPAIPDAQRVTARDVPLAAPYDGVTGSDCCADGEAGEALPLRAIEWSELTARLSAARDLRQLLRDDRGQKAHARDIGFADAATQFFRTNEDDERPVNPTALEGRKASSGICQDVIGEGHKNKPFAAKDSADTSAMMRLAPDDAREE